MKLEALHKEDSYRWPPMSCLHNFCKTSISIKAASRYLCMDRTILIATISFFSLSKHSKTFPKVPAVLVNFFHLRRQRIRKTFETRLIDPKPSKSSSQLTFTHLAQNSVCREREKECYVININKYRT